MSDDPTLTLLLEQYRAGLEAEVVLLGRLEDVALRQREATTAGDLAALGRVSDDRDQLMAGLVAVEGEIRDVRRALSASRDRAKSLDGYAEAAALHEQALAMASRVLETDAASMEALAAAELARREAAHAVEQGETTLAAYRRVATSPPGATLVDRRG